MLLVAWAVVGFLVTLFVMSVRGAFNDPESGIMTTVALFIWVFWPALTLATLIVGPFVAVGSLGHKIYRARTKESEE